MIFGQKSKPYSLLTSAIDHQLVHPPGPQGGPHSLCNDLSHTIVTKQVSRDKRRTQLKNRRHSSDYDTILHNM